MSNLIIHEFVLVRKTVPYREVPNWTFEFKCPTEKWAFEMWLKINKDKGTGPKEIDV